ncbi:MAG: phosphoribosylformylglycinamidine synthase subunit PurL [Deltaproteobacteria bacterium]|nr:phosphoribosylformylglycinamidine synthase subunit PurL [Deltaproteobacteria bacterium]
MITPQIIKEHGLSDAEYGRIQKALGRAPTFVELGIFSAMWSEHCSYKSSRVYLKSFPTKGADVLQGPGENAGVIDIGGGMALAFKMESHNHPSFIEPYQGAATGVGGILRDIFTMGARPVASLNSLRFGSTENPKTRFLLEGVVSGIAGYGNCIGVPTVGGEVFFNESYDGNCLVNVMTVGVLKKDRIFKGMGKGAGNPVIYAGSKTGRDGIHGAVMASDVFGAGGEERRPTVQVGDPFSEKLLLEACLELFKTDHVIGIQDMGAAGLTSSSAEMASRGKCGMEIYIDAVPRREDGMSAYEVMLSESQERMLIVVKKGTEDAVREIFHKWDLDACVIGKITDDGKLRVIEGGKTAAEIPIVSLTDGAPVYDRPVKRPAWQDGLGLFDVEKIPQPLDRIAPPRKDCAPTAIDGMTYNDAALRILSSLNVASKSWIYRQFDYMVRTDTMVCPGSDAAMVRIKGTDKAIAMTIDCNSRYCYLDPFKGAALAVAEAARNLSVSGARPVALTDCLNFGNPERPEVMWQFKEAVRGIREACLAFGIPVVSGNVSLYNETSGKSVYPTPVIGMIGIIDDIKDLRTQWFQNKGDVIGMLGVNAGGLGGSEYLKVLHGVEKGQVHLDLDAEKKVGDACLKAIKNSIIISSHDVSDGGALVALAECCLNPGRALGAQVELPLAGMRLDEALFGEFGPRAIVSFKEKDAGALEKICSSCGISFKAIGVVKGDALKIGWYVNLPVSEIQDAWGGALERFVNG